MAVNLSALPKTQGGDGASGCLEHGEHGGEELAEVFGVEVLEEGHGDDGVYGVAEADEHEGVHHLGDRHVERHQNLPQRLRPHRDSSAHRAIGTCRAAAAAGRLQDSAKSKIRCCLDGERVGCLKCKSGE